MSKKIKKIYTGGPVNIDLGLLTGTIYFNVHDVKEIKFTKAKERKDADRKSYYTRKLRIFFSNYEHGDKLETIQITMFTDDPTSITVS